MSEKQKTMNGYRQKMRKYLKWARQNAQELYEEVWGQLDKYGAETPDDLTMVPPEVLIQAHDELGKQFQQFVQKREEEKRKEIVSTVNDCEPMIPEEPQLQRQQVEERASKLLARIEDDAASGDVPEEILTALLVNDWAEVPVQDLYSMVDVAERALDEVAQRAKQVEYARKVAALQALTEEDESEALVVEEIDEGSVPTLDSIEASISTLSPDAPSAIPPHPTSAAEVGEGKVQPQRQRREFVPREEWPDCPNPHNLPNCMGKCAPIRNGDGFHKLCKVCYLYEEETKYATVAVGEAILVEEEQATEPAIVEVEVAQERELGLLYSRRSVLPVGKQRYATTLVNNWRTLLANQIAEGPNEEAKEALQAAILYLRANLPESIVTAVDQQLVVQSLTGLVALETSKGELRFCPRCAKKKPAGTFLVFEYRYSWLREGHDILNWVGKEICADCVSNLGRTAHKLRPKKAKRDICPRCRESVPREKRQRFEVRHAIPEGYWIQRWKGIVICWSCIKYLAGKAFEASQELTAKTVQNSPPAMSEAEWAALLASEERRHGPTRGSLDEPLVDKAGMPARQPQGARQRVVAEAVA